MSISQTVQIVLDGVAIFILGALGYQILFASRRRRRESEESLQWPSTPGTVTTSHAARHDRMGRSGSYETAHISYEYTVAGKKYKSTRFSFDNLEKLATTDAQLQSVLERYPKGKELTVYYDPQDPQSSILFPKVTRASVVQAYNVAGIIFSAAGLLFAVKLIVDLMR